MKNTLALVLVIATTSLLTGSCCTKQECITVNQISSITMKGFSSTETDTVLLESFAAGSGFSQRNDSVLIFPSDHTGSNGEAYLGLPEQFEPDQDYRLVLQESGLSYSITGIELKQATCNKCVGSSDKYNLLKSYWINGKKTESNEVVIVK